MKQLSLLAFAFLLFLSLPAQPLRLHCPLPGNVKGTGFNVGVLPEFPGGDSAMQHWFAQQLVLTKKMQTQAEGQRIRVAFTVDTNGAVGNINLASRSSECPDADSLVIQAFCAMPAWIPGSLVKEGSAAQPQAYSLMADVYYASEANGKKLPAHIEIKELPPVEAYKPDTKAEPIFSFAEKMPEPGWNFQEYLAKNMHYPEAERKAGKQGTVYVEFVVEKDGSISNVSVVKGVPDAPGFSEEAIRVIREMPAWMPGTVNGHPVRVKITQPIKFVL